MGKPHLIILCGLPFAGKTTLAQTLVHALGWHCISMDAINDERGIGCDVLRITPEQWVETYTEMYGRLRNSLLENRAVILDAPSFTKAQRLEVQSIGDACGAQSQIIYVNVSEKEALRRLHFNRHTSERFDVHEEDFEIVRSGFEPPDESENALVYDYAMPMDAWVHEIFCV